MKNKALIGLIATATIGTAIAAPTVLNNQNTTHIVNKVLMVSNSATNEAVVVNGNSNMNLYALSNGKGIISNLSVGEMLTIIGNQQGNYCKVKVQETGAVGYISISNMQNILNGTSESLTQLSKSGQIINVSSNVRLRSNPSISNNVITNLSNGTQFNILGKQGQWYKVSVNGQIGFIYEEYVSTNMINSSVQSSSTSNINRQINNHISSSGIGSVISNSTRNISNDSSSEITSKAKNSNDSSSEITSKAKNSNDSSSNKNKITLGSKSKELNATFSLATMNKNCALYEAPGGGQSLKLIKGETIFVLNVNSNYQIQKGWVFVRTALGAGYLPATDFTISNQNKYCLESVNKTCNLLSAPHKDATPVILGATKNLLGGAQVFVPINSTVSTGWSLAFVSSSPTLFKQGYIQTNNLTPISRVEEP